MSQPAKAASDRRCCRGVASELSSVKFPVGCYDDYVLLMLGLGLRVNLGFSLTATTVGTAIHPVLIVVSIGITTL